MFDFNLTKQKNELNDSYAKMEKAYDSLDTEAQAELSLAEY